MTDQPRGAAFFDLDRTLISGSSVFVFGVAAWRNKIVPTGDLLNDARKAVVFRLGGESTERTDWVRNRILGAIQGARVEDLKALGGYIIPHLLEEVRSESKGLVDLHHDAGRDTYVVSASPIEIVEDFAGEMGMNGAIATVAEVVDGMYTGNLAEPFCYGQGKADAIAKLAAARGYDLALSYAYSDSINDLPMLEIVGHPVAVNPDRGLEAVARQRGWPIVEFNRRAKKVMKRTTAAAGAVALATATYMLGRYQANRAIQARRRTIDVSRLAGVADRLVAAAAPVISTLRR